MRQSIQTTFISLQSAADAGKSCHSPASSDQNMNNSNLTNIDQSKQITNKLQSCDSKITIKHAKCLSQPISEKDERLQSLTNSPFIDTFLTTNRKENISKGKETVNEMRKTKQVLNIKNINRNANLNDFSNQHTNNNFSASKQSPNISCLNIFNSMPKKQSKQGLLDLTENRHPTLFQKPEQTDYYSNTANSNCSAIKSLSKGSHTKQIHQNSEQPTENPEFIKKLNSIMSKGVDSRKIFCLQKVKLNK